VSRLAHVRRHPFVALWLAVVWVGLWGSVTAANVLGGVAVAVALLALLPLPEQATEVRVSQEGDGPVRVRPVAVVRYVLYFAVELVKASLIVVWQVLRPGGELRQAVLAVDAAGASDLLLTVVANSVSLTPGTLTVEVDRERAVLYVHALDVGGPDGVDNARRSIERLMRVAALAVGGPEHLTRPGPRPPVRHDAAEGREEVQGP
jgi:multicomponent Na+:H+ antiporter subunit E